MKPALSPSGLLSGAQHNADTTAGRDKMQRKSMKFAQSVVEEDKEAFDRVRERRKSVVVEKLEERRKSFAIDKMELHRKSIMLDVEEEKRMSITVDQLEEKRKSIAVDQLQEKRKSNAVDQLQEKRKSVKVDQQEEKRKSITFEENKEIAVAKFEQKKSIAAAKLLERRRTTLVKKLDSGKKSIVVAKLEERRKTIVADTTEPMESKAEPTKDQEVIEVSKRSVEDLPEAFEEEDQDDDEDDSDDDVLFQRKSLLRDDSQEELDIDEPISVRKPMQAISILGLMPSYLAREVHGLRTKSITESRMELMERQKIFVTVFESIALGVILEELDLQLEILGHTFPGICAASDDTEFLTYDEKFSMEVAEREKSSYLPPLKHFKNPFLIDETQVGTHFERTAAKVQKDRAFLHKIIILAKQEIIETRSFEHLKENVKREDGRRHEEITLMEREKFAQEEVCRMTKKISDYKSQSEADEHNRKELINNLRDQLFETKQKGYGEARYSRGKYGAKNEFVFWQLKHQTDLQKLKIKNLEIEMTRDRDSNINIESWSEILCGEILRNTKEWTEKFDRDLEEIERKIKEKNDSIRSQKLLMEELNAEIEQHMIVLGPYEDQKIENFRLNRAAKKIQRWWRKYMKKHKLYKKKGKGKGKGSKKGKGKKKR